MKTKPGNKLLFLQNRNLSALALSILTLFSVWLLQNEKPRGSSPFFFVFFGALLFFLFKACHGIRNMVLDPRAEYLLSFFFSFTTVLGVFFDLNISFGNMSILQALKWVFCALILSEPVKRVIRLLCGALACWARKEETTTLPPGEKPLRPAGRFLSGKPAVCFLFSLAVILVCWLPVWLAYYPGLWNYDPWQADQVISGVYSKHHPLLHTLLLGNCYRLALEHGNASLAPVLYSAVQGGICSMVFALTCTLIRLRTRSTVFFVISLLYFALFPVHPVLAMSTTKDTLFSAMILLAGLLFLFMEEGSPRRQKLLIAAEIPVLALVILLRNNAKYCFLLLILLSLFMLKKKQWRRILLILTAGTLLGVTADWGLGRVLKASPALIAEMCSVPSQMAGRIREQVDSPDPETSAFLEEFYDMDELSYIPALADATKCCLRLESRTDLIRYITGSFRLFLKYPAVSIDSLLYTTEGLWNLQDISHTRIYGTKSRQGYLSTDIQSGYDIVPDSRLPSLEGFLENLFTENAFLNIPVLRYLFAPAFYVDLLLLAFCAMLRGKRRKYLLIPLFLILLIFTIALGPGILPRYVYPLMVCAPLLVFLAMKSVRQKAPAG